MDKKILVILGHPDTESFCGALAKAYLEGAEASAADVRLLNLADLNFDPILWKGYHEIQELEPDLIKAQELIRWSNHMVFIYPNWWGTMPALMKGFFDRAFLPGFAFKYRANSLFWDKLLTGRTAHLIVTMDTPPWYYRWIYHKPGHNEMKRAILGFCGIKVTQITNIATVKDSLPKMKDKWLSMVERLGSKAG
ncbi:MAG: NAD(P)H-dependent oxidoreductase [Hydrogenovibrio crunogenus]|uniref:Flavodoxin-like fold family protein n=1 Tax=Hydrogenovibrio crunogenus (strain DSM 25203 / XCL-2) TaxID=317025 RepID=Q31GW5_HYDCU|nr:NAD(P)H-dependent oxidoreductase [Hydrogenovibrio crunogenus]